MQNIELKINSLVEIYNEDIMYKCVVQDIKDEYMLINIPIAEGNYLHFNKGDILELNYCGKRGYYYFECNFIGKEKENNMPMYKISKPYNIKIVQRRNYFRVDLIEECYYSKIQENEEEKCWHQGLILDLSGGGMKIQTRGILNAGDSINLRIPEDDYEIELKTEVIREIKQENIGHIYGINFINLDENTRDKIVKKVFTHLRKQIKVI